MTGVNVSGTSEAMAEDRWIEGGERVIRFRALIRLRR